ncbi:MAG: hypothetical protein LBB89_00090 [Treponema sp.]|jgi:hypothetical protein|nr:hypothetical protein [Treponema sp.]
MEGIKVLNTEELNNEIKSLFHEEKGQLIIVCPFFCDMDNDLIDLLKSSSATIHFFYQKPYYRKEDKIKSIKKDLSDINFIEVDRLHAKAYISKRYSIITSLNLSSTTYRNNFEIGIIFENDIFKELYNKLISQLKIVLKENDYSDSFLEDNKIIEISYDEYNRGRSQGREVLNMKYLYRGIMEKNGKNWVIDDEDDTIYKNICKQMIQEYKDYFNNLSESPYYKDDKNILRRQTWINSEMYKHGIDNIKL